MADNGGRPLRWYQGLSRYHWWVLAIGVKDRERLFIAGEEFAP